MALPTRCRCGCWIAPHLHRCPKCGKTVVRPVPNKGKADDEQVAMERLDAKAKVLQGSKLRWVLPVAAQAIHRALYERLTARKMKGSHRKLSKLYGLAERKGAWSWEYHTVRSRKTRVVISPKGNRYVTANPHEHADLIIESMKHGVLLRARLRRWEKSSLKKELRQEEREHVKRKKAKREKRSRRLARRSAESE